MDLDITNSIEDGKMTEYPTNVKELFDNINKICRVFPFVSNCAYEEIPLLDGEYHRYIHESYVIKTKGPKTTESEEKLVKAIWADLKEFLGGHGREAILMWRMFPEIGESEGFARLWMRFAINSNADVSYKPTSYKVEGEEVMLIGE